MTTHTEETPAKKYASQRIVQICGQCKYYWEGSPDVTRGLCKRYPPTIIPNISPITAAYPPTPSMETCGEFAR